MCTIHRMNFNRLCAYSNCVYSSLVWISKEICVKWVWFRMVWKLEAHIRNYCHCHFNMCSDDTLSITFNRLHVHVFIEYIVTWCTVTHTESPYQFTHMTNTHAVNILEDLWSANRLCAAWKSLCYRAPIPFMIDGQQSNFHSKEYKDNCDNECLD